MRNLSSSLKTPPRGSNARRLSLLLALFTALMLCGAGLANAQEEQEGEGVRRPTVNVKPFEDVALRGRQLVEQGKLTRETTFEASATAELNADGSLVPETVEVVWVRAADEPVNALSRQLIAAVSQSRVLAALKGAKTVRLGLKLDRQNVSVLVAAEMPSAAEAKRNAEGYDILRQFGAVSKRGTAEGELYSRLRFASEDKLFKMTFEAPRAEVARMIADALERGAAKRAAAGEPR